MTKALRVDAEAEEEIAHAMCQFQLDHAFARACDLLEQLLAISVGHRQ